MTTTTTLITLVGPSEQALYDAQALCVRANAQMQKSAHVAVDVVALDAKVRWLTEGVLEQIKLASQVVKTLGEHRARLSEEAKEWDSLRAQHVLALDQVLDACGSEIVPASFWHVGGDAIVDEHNVFLAEPNGINGSSSSSTGSDTLKINGKRAHSLVPTKTLRDFIDERGIEDASDKIDEERNRLDDILASVAHEQYILETHISSASADLDTRDSQPSVALDPLRDDQRKASEAMASRLQEVVAHLQQVENAVHEQEAGAHIAPQDIELLISDTEMLPRVIAEMRQYSDRIMSIHPQFLAQKSTQDARLINVANTLDLLEGLEVLMENILVHQDDVKAEAHELLSGFHEHLDTLNTLRSTYASYRLAYAKLVLELDRRARYNAAAEQLLLGALQTLETMREEEERDRALFFAEQGAYLPDDLCLFVGNTPQRTEIAVGPREELPPLREDIITDARRNVDLWEGRL